jgi:DNA-binding response OmpR family regulator
MTVLIAEDEAPIREVERLYFEREGFTTIETESGKEAISLFLKNKNKINLVILDLNLPERSGIEVCREIRKISAVPIIMVTARTQELDELLGLEIGADDYIKKPFSPGILVARAKTILRRQQLGVVSIGDLTIDPEKMTVKKRDQQIRVTTTQFMILYTLASTPGKVFTREEILTKAYDSQLHGEIFDRTIDAHIKTIRKLIEDDPKNPQYIITMIGRGYKFNDNNT